MLNKILVYAISFILLACLMGCTLSAQGEHIHSYSINTVEATCYSGGYTENTCECGDYYISNETKRLNHEYKETIFEPTCENYGYTLATCVNCNFETTINVKEPLGHDYIIETTDPTCEQDGYSNYTCKRCAHSYIGDAVQKLGHSYKIVTTQPTISANGYDTHICLNCNNSYKDNFTQYVIKYEEVNEKVFVVSPVNVRSGPSKSNNVLSTLSTGDTVTRVGIGENGWSKVVYGDQEAYVVSQCLSKKNPLTYSVEEYPLTYEDDTCKITIERKRYYNAWCYVAHLEFTDYSRFGSDVAKGQRGYYETTSAAAKRLDAIFCTNGPYNWGDQKNTYAIVRSGRVLNDKSIIKDLAIYNSATGVLKNAEDLGINAMMASDAVKEGLVTDTFKFWSSTVVRNGESLVESNDYNKAQRTFIATNENAGDIYVIVSEGRYVDKESAGLSIYECAEIVLDLDCTYGVMMDGGGSSTMVFKGKVLNHLQGGSERAVVDFLYFK